MSWHSRSAQVKEMVILEALKQKSLSFRSIVLSLVFSVTTSFLLNYKNSKHSRVQERTFFFF